MNLELKNTILQELNRATNVLIVLAPNPSGDSLSAALALRGFLEKMDKETTVIAPGALDSRFSFLAGFDRVVSSLAVVKNFVIDVSTRTAPLDELSYRKDGDHLMIYLKPKSGELQASDVSFKTADFPYQLIVTIGVSRLDQLGSFYSNTAELFFQTPILNIDFKSTNESYGQMNLIDLNSTSCSEITMDLLNEYEATFVDETIATALLAGIITETNSFQHTRTAPQTFIKASQLIGQGAKQQEIVTQLYRSKSLNFLKLWGRALARLKQDLQSGLIYTLITRDDVEKSQADDRDLEQVIPEMALQLKLAKVLMVLVEKSAAETEVSVALPPPIDPNMMFGGYQPQIIGPNTVKFKLNAPLTEAEAKISELIRAELGKLAA
jgi:phosphoesterase RecJ-like protein